MIPVCACAGSYHAYRSLLPVFCRIACRFPTAGLTPVAALQFARFGLLVLRAIVRVSVTPAVAIVWFLFGL